MPCTVRAGPGHLSCALTLNIFSPVCLVHFVFARMYSLYAAILGCTNGAQDISEVTATERR
jgi:hypothetical protein